MNIEKLLALLKDTICTECGLTWGETGTGCEDCQNIRKAMAESPTPPSALSGVSAEECMDLALSLESAQPSYWAMASGKHPYTYIATDTPRRAASILRALAESMEGGKG